MAVEKRETEKTEENQENMFLVGIGASAGGLEALQQFSVSCRPTAI